MKRLIAVALGLAVVSVLGCSSGPTIPASPTPKPPPTIPPASPSPNPLGAGHYDDGVLAFDFPAEWNADRSWYPSSVSDLKAYLSTEELRPACVLSGTATLCRNPVISLSPGGVLISWWRWGLHRGNPGPDPTVGELIHVGGRSGRIHDAGAEGHCLGMNADSTLRLEIPDPTLDGSWTVMDACMRNPIGDARSQLDAMLASVTWSAPQPTRIVPGEVNVDLYDDTSLVTAAVAGAPSSGADPIAIANGDTLEIVWSGPWCGQEPILGLSRDSGKILVLLEPFAGPPTRPECDVFSPLSVILTLSESFTQDDVSLEVW